MSSSHWSAFGVEHVSKAKTTPPSQDELKRRKKLSANLTIASSTLGIAGLGAMGAGKLVPMAAKSRNAAKLLPKKVRSPAKAKKFGEKSVNTAWALSTGATGVGGVGGYNYAALQRAEARKKRI